MKGRAGGNIRALAFNRRVDAIKLFFGAAGLAVVPFGIGKLFLGVNLPPQTYLIGVVGGAFLGWQGLNIWQKAARADQGAVGEEEIGQLLKDLPKGWKVEYGLQLRGVGDIDVIVESPNGKVWTIDVKSHRGVVFAQGESLQRRMGNQVYPFEKDFLAAAKKQARLLAQKRKLKFVAPVLVFSAAQVNIPRQRLQEVQILAKADLLHFLLGP